MDSIRDVVGAERSRIGYGFGLNQSGFKSLALLQGDLEAVADSLDIG
jgi:hypothetical protein